MISKLQAYPVMKDSGVEWLGEVPEHWEVRRLGNLLRERGETNADGAVQDVLSVLKGRGVIPYADKGNIGNKRSEDITRYKIVRPDDIVMNSMNVIIGSVGLSRYTGCLSPVYYVLMRCSEGDDPRYLNGYFQAIPFQRSLVRIGKGILAHRMRIPMELLKGELFPRPPPSEQVAIVKYLDYVDRRVRKLVRAKRRLIALLTEQKQAIIQRAVTRGLDPDAPLKDSGVEWLGKIPEHWEVRKVGAVSTRVTKGTTPTTIGKSFIDAGIRFVKVEAISQDRRVLGEMCTFIDSQTDELLARSRLRVDDVLVAIAGAIGRVAVVGEHDCPANCNQAVAIISPRREMISTHWLSLALSSPAARTDLTDKAVQSAQANLSLAELKQALVPLPPLLEQAAIGEHLTKTIADIDTAITSAERQIELLNEYRTRLIADVVTGKLDVREAAAALPEVDPLATEHEPDDSLESDAEAELDDLDATLEEAEA